jgi:co-chaperonin GroES (HSP10)
MTKQQQKQHKVHNEIIPEDYQSELNHINDENIEMIAAKNILATAGKVFRQ